jgi:hypothetical protein
MFVDGASSRVCGARVGWLPLNDEFNGNSTFSVRQRNREESEPRQGDRRA